MPVEPGTNLLHYRLIEKIGEGGMGVVWSAQDTTLQRDVAIKILPETVAADPERLARFAREARLLATLNHPNVAAVYGMHQETEGVPFLAMELVRGEDLSERVARGPLPVDEALEIARAVAEALRAAHAADVIHRDLKPANIRIGVEGEVKVLDFGLAKAMSAEGEGSLSGSVSLSPTVTSLGTVAGVLLGTASYMSPEQARGRAVDKRADIWAFGCVLYELLTGKLAFPGETITDTLAAVVRAEPDWDALPAAVPRGVRRVMQLCLAKNPRERLHDITDAMLLVDELSDEPAENVDAASAGRPGLRERLAWGVAAVAILAAVATAVVMGQRAAAPPPFERATRFSVHLDEDRPLSLSTEPILAYSPDGSMIAFSVEDPTSGRSILSLRALDQRDAWPVPGTEGATNPFFSPDGKQIGFFADGSLKRIAVSGGIPATLADAPNPRGAVWLPDDTIVYSPKFTSGLWRVDAAGGNPKPAVDLDDDSEERTYRWPFALPDGDTVLLTVGSADSPNNYDNATLMAVSLATGARTSLIVGVNMARFVPPDKLAFTRAGSLFYVLFDPKRLKVLGDPIRALEGVGGDPSSGAGFFDVSPGGDLIYVAGTISDAKANLLLVDRDGTREPIPLSSRGFHHPRFSPDGSRLAFTVGVGALGIGGDVWIYSFADSGLRRLTFGGTDLYPVWSPDGSEIGFLRGDATSLFVVDVDGGGEARRVEIDADEVLIPGSWSSDGKWMAVTRAAASTDIHLLNLETQEMTLFAEDASGPVISPDGRWVAYSSPGSGNSSIYVRPLQGEGKWQISSEYAAYPRWSPDGRRLMFLDIEGQRMLKEVDVAEGDVFRSSMPRTILEDVGGYDTSTAPLVNWDTDGERVVFVELLRDDSTYQKVEVVLGWSRELAGAGSR